MKNGRYRLTFELFKTETEARRFSDSVYHNNRYLKRKHPATVVQWSSDDGKCTGFICWYYY